LPGFQEMRHITQEALAEYKPKYGEKCKEEHGGRRRTFGVLLRSRLARSGLCGLCPSTCVSQNCMQARALQCSRFTRICAGLGRSKLVDHLGTLVSTSSEDQLSSERAIQERDFNRPRNDRNDQLGSIHCTPVHSLWPCSPTMGIFDVDALKLHSRRRRHPHPQKAFLKNAAVCEK